MLKMHFLHHLGLHIDYFFDIRRRFRRLLRSHFAVALSTNFQEILDTDI